MDLPKPLPQNEQKRIATLEFNAATRAYIDRWKKNMQSAPGGVRIVELPRANHYLFLSNADDVIRELRTFLSSLSSRAQLW